MFAWFMQPGNLGCSQCTISSYPECYSHNHAWHGLLPPIICDSYGGLGTEQVRKEKGVDLTLA